MIKKLLLTFSYIITLGIGMFAPVSANTLPQALITEVQTGFIDASSGLEYPKQEFIEVANVSAAPLVMDGWQLEYLSAAHDGTGEPTAELNTINGTLPLNGHALFSYIGYNPASSDASFGVGSIATSGMLAKSGGRVRLMNGDIMVDCVAWGSATALTGCDKVSGTSAAGQTIQRPHSDNGSYDKTLGVKHLSPPTPRGGELYPSFEMPEPNPNGPNVPGTEDPEPEVPEEPENPEQPQEPQQPTIPLNCPGVELSEILPNPAGVDTIGEFIELYNTTDQTVSLQGCSLRLGAAGKVYNFAAGTHLQPYEYRAFMYSTTGISLTNSGGEVWLLSPEVQTSLTYPTSADDQAWALIDGVWQTTFQPTPNAPNVLLLPAGRVASLAAAGVEPCPEGKFRNPETNRCKNIETETGPTPCAEGQERNPETNRCRKIAAAATTPTPCAEGQERNPLTNRCRKITTATTQTPCAAGQERNPETNRCRKITTATAKADPDAAKSSGIQNYRILIAVLILILGYAVYEYRQDLGAQLTKLRNSIVKRGSS